MTPKGETELTAEEKLIRAIFKEKAREVRDTSLGPARRGRQGHRRQDVLRDAGDDLSPGVNELVRVYVAKKRKIAEGDKLAGRHGTGVIARIVPEEDMPFLEDGTPVDVVLNPLGVPSRMNIGQVLETHLGWAAHHGVFAEDGEPNGSTPVRAPSSTALRPSRSTPWSSGRAKPRLADQVRGRREAARGRHCSGKAGSSTAAPASPSTRRSPSATCTSSSCSTSSTTRSTRVDGALLLVTQQPLGGKAQFGGQRFGEMEVWALEAYGAAYTLQEMLTIKSDDTVGRVKAYEAIVKGENIAEPSIPESFKVLLKEMQSLALDVNVISEEGAEVEVEEDDELLRAAEELGIDLARLASARPPGQPTAEEAEEGRSASTRTAS